MPGKVPTTMVLTDNPVGDGSDLTPLEVSPDTGDSIVLDPKGFESLVDQLQVAGLLLYAQGEDLADSPYVVSPDGSVDRPALDRHDQLNPVMMNIGPSVHQRVFSSLPANPMTDVLDPFGRFETILTDDGEVSVHSEKMTILPMRPVMSHS